MTYNVLLTAAHDGDTVRAVGAADAEIVALQEVTPAWKDVLSARYAERYPHMLFRTEGGAGGLAVLSEYPVEDRGFRVGPGEWHPAWHVVVHTPMGPVQLLNVHLRPLFSGGGDPVRSYLTSDEDHREQIEHYADDCNEALPTIVLGDFNEGPEGGAVRWLEARDYRNALPLFHPGQETYFFAGIGGQLAETVDHVMFGPTFEPLNAWVERRGGSDHIPVVAHLEAAHH